MVVAGLFRTDLAPTGFFASLFCSTTEVPGWPKVECAQWVPMIRVVLVDDQTLMRGCLCHMLAEQDDIEVVGEAGSGEAAIELLSGEQADVVLMDLRMPGIGGLVAIRKLLRIQPGLKIVVVSELTEDPFPSRVMEAGAVGYVTKGSSFSEIIDAVHKAARGKRYLCREVAEQIALTHVDGGGRSPFESLSARELQVTMMLAEGMRTPEISDQLCLSPKTISTYRYRLYEKLGVHSDVEVMQLAMRHGVIDGPPAA